MKDAFIFDLDGTLLDSMGIWENIGRDYLAQKGIENIPESIREILKPMSLLEAAEYFAREFNIKKSPREICAEINRLVDYKYLNEVDVKDGVREFLKANSRIKSCIATATDKDVAQGALRRLGLAECFEFVITLDEVGKSKQSPDIFIRAAKLLGAGIEGCVVFEDALHAIKAAKSAGFYTVGVYEKSFEGDMEEIKKYADQYVRDLREVIL